MSIKKIDIHICEIEMHEDVNNVSMHMPGILITQARIDCAHKHCA